MTYIFVLVHGANHDGSAWDQVITRLEELGHTAFAPTVRGHGPDGAKQLSHTESTNSIVDFIIERELSEIVLVGHSFGGSFVSKVAEAIPERIRRLVYWSALVLQDGEAPIDAAPPSARQLFTELAAQSLDNTLLPTFPMFRELYMNDGDVEIARTVYAKLWPAPFNQVIEPIELKRFYDLPTPRSYLFGTEDMTMPPGEWSWHPRMSSRLGLYRLVQMPGGHELFFTNPRGLADKLVEAGRD
jgi:pimeloyl-ACP methyl ester carboxylesterase